MVEEIPASIESEELELNLDELMASAEPVQEESVIEESVMVEELPGAIEFEELDLDLEEITIYQNEEILAHVWKNLISNAIKFSKPDGFLYLKCKRTSDHIHISIEDTGTGMTEETMKQIFEKFYQGDTSHATDGNGLGLALVRRVMDIVQGEIRVESAVGEGTVFTVRIRR